ncbi:MAG: MFS transporter [Microgenomates group bacterium]
MYKKNIRLLKIFNFLIGFSLFAPLAIIYFSRVYGSYALGASVFGITMLASAIFEVPTGIWSDRVGRRGTIILGSWARVIAFILYAVGLSYWWLVAGAILEGLSRAFYSGNNDAFLYDTLADSQKENDFDDCKGKISSTEQLSMGIAALIGGIVANFSFVYLMWLSLISQFIMLYISYLFIDPLSHKKNDANIYAHIKEALELFIHNKKLRLLSLASMLSYSVSEMKWEFSSAFTATVWPLWAIGISKMLPSFGASLSFYFSGKIIRKFKAETILFFDSVSAKIASFIAYGFPSIFSPIILSLTSLLYGADSVAETTLMQKEFSDHQRATMGSLNSLGGSVGFAIMSILLGSLADKFGPAQALIILTIVSLPVIYLYWLIFRNKRRSVQLTHA